MHRQQQQQQQQSSSLPHRTERPVSERESEAREERAGAGGTGEKSSCSCSDGCRYTYAALPGYAGCTLRIPFQSVPLLQSLSIFSFLSSTAARLSPPSVVSCGACVCLRCVVFSCFHKLIAASLLRRRCIDEDPCSDRRCLCHHHCLRSSSSLYLCDVPCPCICLPASVSDSASRRRRRSCMSYSFL